MCYSQIIVTGNVRSALLYIPHNWFNPHEKLFRNEVVNGLMKEYGFCVVSIGDIEVLNEVTGIGKQI